MPLSLPIFLKFKKRKKRRAFSLVELLISLSIFAVVSVAIYSTFSSGTQVLRKVKNIDLTQQAMLLKEERFSRELRQSVILRKPLFLGAKDKLIFGAIVNDKPGRITYYFDKSTQAILRAFDNLGDIITSEGKVDPELKSKPAVFLTKVTEIKFSYFYLDLTKNIYKWVEVWSESYLPLAVKLEITTEKQNYATTVFLPTA